MRKIYTFFIVMVVAVFSANAQPVFPFSEDFESFIVDQGIFDQVSTTADSVYWSVWSGEYGTAEDAAISDVEAIGSQSVVISGTNDLVYFPGAGTGALEEGRYKVTLNIFVPDSTTGYYNFLQHFDGGGSAWGYQIQFEAGVASIDGGGSIDVAYPMNQWMNIVSFVDLDADWCEIYFDDELVHSFQWSVGTSNTNILKWDAINFYAWAPTGGVPTAYFDDLMIEEVAAPEAPANLAATVENEMDVVLTWDAPTGMTPLKYILTKNGSVIAELTDGTTYTDVHVYPATYEYGVRAVYDGIGTSSAVTTSATIEGGVAREYVLFEQLNALGEPMMNPSNRGLKEAADSLENLAVISYYINDAVYGGEAQNQRLFDYYGDLYYAAIWADGVYSHSADGSITGSFKYDYVAIYDQMKAIPSVIGMDMEVIANEDGTYTANVDLTEEFAYYEDGLVLRFALTESNIEEATGFDGKLNFVARHIDTTGIAVEFVDGAQSISADFTVEGDIENYELIAFVQHDPSKSVTQAVASMLPAITPMVDVTFNVTMGECAGDNDVYLTGGYWGWNEPGQEGSHMMMDEDGDGIYSITLPVAEGTSDRYKYFVGAGWDNGDMFVGACENGDRCLVVDDVALVLDDVYECEITSLQTAELGLVEMYPNPFTNTLTINNLENVNQITISNVVGQTVMIVDVDEAMEVISTSELQNGVYFVTLTDAANNVHTKRVVKQ